METRKPHHKIKVGAVGVAIWKQRQESSGGKAFDSFKVVLDRSYRDSDGNWASTGRLDINDVPKAVLALSKAYEYLMVRNGSNGGTDEPEEEGEESP